MAAPLTPARPRARSRRAPSSSTRAHVSPASPVTSIAPPRNPTSSRPGCSGSAASAYGIRRRSRVVAPACRSPTQPIPRASAAAATGRLPRPWAAYGERLTDAYHRSGSAGSTASPTRSAGRARRPAGASSRRGPATPRSPVPRPRTGARARAGASAAGGRRCAPAGCGRSRSRRRRASASRRRARSPRRASPDRSGAARSCSRDGSTAAGGKTSVARSAARRNSGSSCQVSPPSSER